MRRKSVAATPRPVAMLIGTLSKRMRLLRIASRKPESLMATR